ncbi:MAG: aminotransferase class I/II-fold pyridoxal phosphate-dependent enzyme [Balneolaceae bacterium]|nr:aminotransferase class I/II-fold pyridoxal phosphate-dependent enzyme [Balneolaceae bacterium]
MKSTKNIETIAIHSGSKHWSGSRGIASPMEPATTYEHDITGYQEGDFIYSRYENPNRLQLEQLLCSLEQGEACASFSSGVAALTAMFMSVPKGAHVLIPEDMYHGSRSLLETFANQWGISYSSVDTTNLEAFVEAIQPETKLALLESPSNPLLLITDLEKTIHVAHQKGVSVCVDNTFSTPFNTNPIVYGADFVMHSTSKFLGGHSDIIGGAIITAKTDAQFDAIRIIQRKQGSVPSPFDCWLLARSIRSFPHRMRMHNQNAWEIAQFLITQDSVEKVFYPGLPSHKDHEIAAAQMKGFGGMVSLLIDGDGNRALEIVGRTKIIRRATSLGGIESLWEHRRSSEGEHSTTPENLIRFSVGLEHVKDLAEDLAQALK